MNTSVIRNNVQRDRAEEVILDMASLVVNNVTSRRQHPSYGYTKTAITALYEQMEGAIGLYMVLDGQSNTALVPSLAIFLNTVVRDRVQEARVAWQSL